MQRAQRQDADAWEALYRNRYGSLMSFARRRLPDRQEADDAVSETFARAVRNIDGFTWRGAGFDAWLYGILRNVVYEMARRHTRTDPHQVSDVQSDDADPLERTLLRDEASRLRSAFALLGPEDREVLELRVVAGLDADQVAAVLGKRAGAVRMAQSRALGRLRETLERADKP